MAGPQRSHYAYDDQQGILGTALAGVTTFTPKQVRNTGIVLPHITSGDVFTMVYQFSHRKKLGSLVASVHLHFIPIVAKIGSLRFAYTWGFYNHEDVIPDTLPNTGNTLDIELVEADQYKLKLKNLLVNLPHPATEKYSDILMVKFAGAAPAAGTNWWTTGNELAITYLDSHYITDRNGSALETADV